MIEIVLFALGGMAARHGYRWAKRTVPYQPPVRPRGRSWELPPSGMLATPVRGLGANLGANPDALMSCLAGRGVPAQLAGIVSGPTVVRYELALGNVRVSRFTGLRDDLSVALGANVRLLAPVPGKTVVGVEVSRADRETVTLGETITDATAPLDIVIGKGVDGQTVKSHIPALPHVLVAGATKAGKSVFLNSLIVSVLMNCTPDDAELVLIDPKCTELTQYAGLPHLSLPVITETDDALTALQSAVDLMDERYRELRKAKVRDIEGARAKGIHMPYQIIIIDELADLMSVAKKRLEHYIGRLAQKGRAAGIHLVIATQRPSVDVVTGVIKANLPARAAFTVAHGVDSRVILDRNGAEVLAGKGDMLWNDGSAYTQRVQSALVTDDEIERVTQWWIKQTKRARRHAMA